MAPRLREKYLSEIRPELMKDRGYSNAHQVPRLEKIVCNMGLGQAIQNPKILESAMEELAQITGQKPVATRARKAISNFKLRKGMAIGCRVTLRRDRMYEFFDRLVTVALPRVRDFKGVSPRSFDGAGNYSLGIQEHAIFPEIDLDKIDTMKGLTVSICTTAKTDDEGRDLLKRMGFPFRT